MKIIFLILSLAVLACSAIPSGMGMAKTGSSTMSNSHHTAPVGAMRMRRAINEKLDDKLNVTTTLKPELNVNETTTLKPAADKVELAAEGRNLEGELAKLEKEAAKDDKKGEKRDEKMDDKKGDKKEEKKNEKKTDDKKDEKKDDKKTDGKKADETTTDPATDAVKSLTKRSNHHGDDHMSHHNSHHMSHHNSHHNSDHGRSGHGKGHHHSKRATVRHMGSGVHKEMGMNHEETMVHSNHKRHIARHEEPHHEMHHDSHMMLHERSGHHEMSHHDEPHHHDIHKRSPSGYETETLFDEEESYEEAAPVRVAAVRSSSYEAPVRSAPIRMAVRSSGYSAPVRTAVRSSSYDDDEEEEVRTVRIRVKARAKSVPVRSSVFDEEEVRSVRVPVRSSSRYRRATVTTEDEHPPVHMKKISDVLKTAEKLKEEEDIEVTNDDLTLNLKPKTAADKKIVKRNTMTGMGTMHGGINRKTMGRMSGGSMPM